MGAPVSGLRWQPADYLRRLVTETAEFERLLRGATTADHWDVRVPMSKTWRLRDLAVHLSGIHRWAASIVESGRRQTARARPPDGTDLADWYHDSAAMLLDALAAADPERQCWNFSRTPRLTAFWYRRQAHETAVHRWDAGQAVGAPVALPAAQAADGVDEALAVMMPLSAPPLAGPLLLQTSDTGHRWLLTPTGDAAPAVAVLDAAAAPANPAAADPRGTASARAAVTARAEDLLLCVWKRRSLAAESVLVEGDRSLVETFWSARLTP